MADAPPPRLPGVGALDTLVAAAASVHAPPQRPRAEPGLSTVAEAAAALSSQHKARMDAVRLASPPPAPQAHQARRDHPGALASISEWAPPPQPSLPSVHALPSIAYDVNSAHRVGWHQTGYVQPGLPPTQIPGGHPTERQALSLSMPAGTATAIGSHTTPVPVGAHSWGAAQHVSPYTYSVAPLHPHHQSIPRQYYYAPLAVQASTEHRPPMLPPVVAPSLPLQQPHQPPTSSNSRREVDVIAHERMDSPPDSLNPVPLVSADQPSHCEEHPGKPSPLPPMLTSPLEVPAHESALSAVAYVAAAAAPLPPMAPREVEKPEQALGVPVSSTNRVVASLDALADLAVSSEPAKPESFAITEAETKPMRERNLVAPSGPPSPGTGTDGGPSGSPVKVERETSVPLERVQSPAKALDAPERIESPPASQPSGPSPPSASPACSTPIATSTAGAAPRPAPGTSLVSERKPTQRNSGAGEMQETKGRSRSKVKGKTGSKHDLSVAAGGRDQGKSTGRPRSSAGRDTGKERDDESSTQGGEITRCPCGSTANSAYMVACDECNTWQHYKCMGIRRKGDLTPDKKYYCHLCRPEEMRPNCIAHPRYKERMQNKDRERQKGTDPALSGVKPLELRRLFSADLRSFRSDPGSVDTSELFTRYGGLFRGQFGKDKQSVIEGLAVVTDMLRADVQSRLEAVLKKMRGAAGRAGASSLPDANVIIPEDTTRATHASATDGGFVRHESVEVGTGDQSPNLSDRDGDEGSRVKRLGKAGNKRSRPASLATVGPESILSVVGEAEGGSGISPSDPEMAMPSDLSRNMSREDRKLHQVLQMFKKMEQQQERGKKRPRTTTATDSPKYVPGESPRTREIPSDSSHDPDGPSILPSTKSADVEQPASAPDEKLEHVRDVAEPVRGERSRRRAREMEVPSPAVRVEETDQGGGTSPSENRHPDLVDRKQSEKERVFRPAKERILTGVARERTKRRNAVEAPQVTVPSALAAARRTPTKPPPTTGKGSAELAPIDPALLIKVHVPGPSFLRSKLVPSSRRSSLDVAAELKEQERNAEHGMVRKLRKEWMNEAAKEASAASAKPQLLPAKKYWLKEKFASPDCNEASDGEKGLVDGKSKTNDVGKRESVRVSMVIVSERKSLPDNGRKLESSLGQDPLGTEKQSVPAKATDIVMNVCDHTAPLAFGASDVRNNILVRRAIVAARSGALASCIKKRPSMLFDAEQTPTSARSPILNLRSVPLPPSSPGQANAPSLKVSKAHSPKLQEIPPPKVVPPTSPNRKALSSPKPSTPVARPTIRSPIPQTQSPLPKRRRPLPIDLAIPHPQGGADTGHSGQNTKKKPKVSPAPISSAPGPSIPRKMPPGARASEKVSNERIPRLSTLKSVVPSSSLAGSETRGLGAASTSPTPSSSRPVGSIGGQQRTDAESKARDALDVAPSTPISSSPPDALSKPAKIGKAHSGPGRRLSSSPPPTGSTGTKFLGSPPWRPSHRGGPVNPSHESRYARGPRSNGSGRNSFPPTSNGPPAGRMGSSSGTIPSGSPSAAIAAWSSFRQRSGWNQPNSSSDDGSLTGGQKTGSAKSSGGFGVPTSGGGAGQSNRSHRGGDH